MECPGYPKYGISRLSWQGNAFRSVIPWGTQIPLGGDGIQCVAQLGKNRTDKSNLVRSLSFRDTAGQGGDRHHKFTGIHRDHLTEVYVKGEPDIPISPYRQSGKTPIQ